MSEAQEKPVESVDVPPQLEEPVSESEPAPASSLAENPLGAQAKTTLVNDNEIKVFSAPVASTSSSIALSPSTNAKDDPLKACMSHYMSVKQELTTQLQRHQNYTIPFSNHPSRTHNHIMQLSFLAPRD
jgi:hypothetical protein